MSAGGDTDGDQDPHTTDPTDCDIRHDDPDVDERMDIHAHSYMYPETSTRQKQHRLETLLRKTQGPLCAETQRYTIPQTKRQICGNNISR